MNVEEVCRSIELLDFQKAIDQVKQLSKEADSLTDYSNLQPRTVTIGHVELWDFLYLLSTEITRYGEMVTLHVKYLRVVR